MKLIPLTQGKHAIVDDDDFEWINQWKWCVSNGYAARAIVNKNGRKSLVMMHRVIMKLPDGVLVDHKNGSRVDNRRENLRPCSYVENQRNQKLTRLNLTGLKGARLNKRNGTYRSSIKFLGKQISLGTFKTALEAHMAYCEKAKELFGEFARFE